MPPAPSSSPSSISARIDRSGATKKYHEIPRFPSTQSRQSRLLAPITLAHEQIVTTLSAAHEPLLERVEIFDVFTDPTGARVSRRQKSLAYSLTYRAPDRTLNRRRSERRARAAEGAAQEQSWRRPSRIDLSQKVQLESATAPRGTFTPALINLPCCVRAKGGHPDPVFISTKEAGVGSFRSRLHWKTEACPRSSARYHLVGTGTPLRRHKRGN